MSAFEHVDAIVPKKIWDGIASRGRDGEQVTLTLLELDPRAVVAEHSHVNEQVGILIEGGVTFTIGDETAEVSPGDTWVIPPHVPHSVVTGADGALIVEVFSPPRHDWSALDTLPPGRGRWP